MKQDILEQMAFSLDLIENDARLLDMTFLAQILSMAAVEIAEARKQNASVVTDHTNRSGSVEQSPVVVGGWRWDLAGDRMAFDPEVARFLDLPLHISAYGVPLAVFIDAVHALDRPRVTDAFARAVSQDDPLHIVFRIKSAGGPVKRVFAVGRAVFENDRATVFPGTILDVTDSAPKSTRGKRLAPADFRRSSRSGKNRMEKEWLA